MKSMTDFETILTNGLALLGVINLICTLRVVFAKKLTSRQKILHTLIIWFLPILGAVYVLFFVLDQKSKRKKKRSNNTAADHNIDMYVDPDM